MKKLFFSLLFLLIPFGLLSEVRAGNWDDWTNDQLFGENSLWQDMVGVGQGPVPGGSFTLPCPQDFAQVGDNYSLRQFILNVVNFGLSFLGILGVVMVIYAGFLYVTAGGDDTQQEKGKKIIIYSSIGIVVILISFALVNTLIRNVGTGGDDRDFIQGGQTFSGNIVGIPNGCDDPSRRPESFIPGSIVVKLSGGETLAPNFGGGVMVSLAEASQGEGLKFHIDKTVNMERDHLWDFGDGSQDNTSGGDVPHVFGEKRAYRVSFVGYDPEGKIIKATTVVVVEGVEAKFTAETLTPGVNKEVELDASASRIPVGSITGYEWTCVDNTIETPASVDGCFAEITEGKEKETVSFREPGEYTVSLTTPSSVCNGATPPLCATGTTSQEFNVENSTPTASFLLRQSEDPLKPSEYTFDATSSRSIEGKSGGLQYDWKITKYQVGGTTLETSPVITNIPQAKIVTYTFEAPGKYQVSLTVTENYKGREVSGVSNQDIDGVKTIGVDFLVPISTIVDQNVVLSAKTNQAETFSWEAFDSGGEALATSPFTTPTTLSETTAVFGDVGVYKVKLTGTKGTDTGEKEKVVFVRGEGMPLAVVKITKDGTEDVTSNSLEIDRVGYADMTFDGSGSIGANGLTGAEANLNSTWSIDGTIVPPGADISTALRLKLFEQGKAGKARTVKLLVSDKGNQNAQHSVSFQIKVNNLPPTVTSVTRDEASPLNNHKITIVAADTDSGTITQYRFEILENGQVKDTQVSDADTAYFNLTQFPGAHTFLAKGTVTDNEQGTGTRMSAPFSVDTTSPNQPPVVSRIVPLNGSNEGNTTTNFRFQAVASDPDGDQLNYTWSLKKDGQDLGLVFLDSPMMQYRFTAVGNYTVKVEVNDGETPAPLPSAELNVVVEAVAGNNLPPRITRIRVTPQQRVVGGDPFMFFAEAEDPEDPEGLNDNLRYTWSVLRPDMNRNGAALTGDRVTYNPTADGVDLTGNYEVKLTVTEVEGETVIHTVESAVQRVQVVPEGVEVNLAPRISRVQIAPLQREQGSDIPFVFVVEATDPDAEGEEALTYEWTVEKPDLSPVAGLENNARITYLPAQNEDILGIYSVRVRVADTDGAVTESSLYQVRVVPEGVEINPPPRITRVNVAPAQGTVGADTEFAFSVEAMDIADEALTYDWTIVKPNLAEEDPTTGNDAERATYRPGVDGALGAYEVYVTVTDEGENSVESSHYSFRLLAAGAVMNQPPRITRINVAPAQGIVGADTEFAFGVEAMDPTGEDLTYNWTIVKPNLEEVDAVADEGNPARATYQPGAEGALGRYEAYVTVEDEAGNKTESQRRSFQLLARGAVMNQPPRITRFDIAPLQGTRGADTEFAFAVEAVDPTGEVLTYNWTIVQPNLAPVNATTGDNAVRATYQPGENGAIGRYEAYVTVTDAAGNATESQRRSFEVLAAGAVVNQPPRIIRLDVAPNQGVIAADTEFAFSVSATDPENAGLTYSWTIVKPNLEEIDATTGDATTRATYRPGVNGALGRYEAYVTVTDAAGNETESQRRSFQLLAVGDVINQPPRILRFDATPTQGVRAAATEFAFSVSAADPEGAALTYNWTIVQPNLAPVDATTGDATTRATYQPGVNGALGRYEAYVTVTDAAGNETESQRRSFQLFAEEEEINVPPLLGSILYSPYSINTATDVIFRLSTARDPDGNSANMTYLWNFDDESTADTAVAHHTFAEAGQYAVTVTVTDEDNVVTVSDPRIVTVVAPVIAQDQPPRITRLDIAPGQGRVNTEFAFAMEAVDADDAITGYGWTVVKPNLERVPLMAGEAPLNAPRATYTPTVTGTYEVIASVTAGGQTVTQRRQFVVVAAEQGGVQNLPPTISRVNVSPGSGQLGTEFAFSVDAVDPENGAITYDWDIQKPNLQIVEPAAGGAERRATYTPDVTGNYEASIKVSDGTNQIIQRRQFVVLARGQVVNQSPRITRMDIAPAQAVRAAETEFALSVTATDPEGAALTYNWTIVQPNLAPVDATIGDDQTRATYQPGAEGALGRYEAYVTVTDVAGNATESQRRSFQLLGEGDVINQPPHISRFEIRPLQARRGEEVSLFVTASDPDGDNNALSYAWTLRGPNFAELAVVGEGNRVSFTPVAENPFGTYEAQVTVTDEDGTAVDSLTREFRVIEAQDEVNQAPRITLFRVSPEQRVLGGDFLLEVQASDDEDITYTWHVMNMANFQVQDIDGGRVVHTPDAVGEYEAWATVTDGENTIQSDVRSIRVLAEQEEINVPPSIGSILYSPFQVQTGTEVLFRLSSATDPDGNSNNLTYLWDFDDGDTANTAISRHTFDAAGQYAVRVTVTDEDDMRTISQPRIITVTAPQGNRAPTVGYIQGRNTAVEGDRLLFSVEAQDPDGANNELQYEWTFSDGEENILEVIDTEFAPWIRHTFDEAGPYALRVRVTDSAGAATLSRIHRIQINPQ